MIGKAIGNLLGSIVTAPSGRSARFRCRRQEARHHRLRARQRHPRHPSGKARNRRPGAQRTPGTDAHRAARHATEPDTLALVADGTQRRDAAHGHRACCRRRPGPVDAANPRARQAIEQAFSARYALRCSPRSRAAPWPNRCLLACLHPRPPRGRKRLLLRRRGQGPPLSGFARAPDSATSRSAKRCSWRWRRGAARRSSPSHH